jgi:hypothetical protein
MKSLARIAAVACAGLLMASLAVAGQGHGADKKAPDQGPQTGRLDDATVEVGGQQVHLDPVTGQLRQPTPEEAAALAAALDRQFGKKAEGVTFSNLPGGGVAARLDDSFMEAMTVTRGADGSLTFGHAPATASPATPASSTKAVKPSRSARPPATSVPAPRLEEK